jgi:hypothetical protein
MKDISVILPIHKWDDYYKEMFANAVDSLSGFYNDIKLIIVIPSKLEIDVSEYLNNFEYEIIKNTKKTNFTTQVNLGLKKCKTKWFTILEIDDEFKPNWLKTITEYTTTYTDVDVFLPIIEDINSEGKFLSYTNESVWAYGFSDVQGYLDNELLLDYQNFQTSGALYKTSIFDSQEFLKDNIELTFSYELLLRLTHNNHKIMSIPKVLYRHVNFREDSLFWSYKNGSNKLEETDINFWVNVAKHEFFFKEKREINKE